VGQRNILGDGEMRLQGLKNFLRAGSALGLLVIATAQANAGGFAVREQSAYGQGSSFAGIAAGGALSSMFWNPATITQVRGISIESDIAGIIPYANQNPSAGSALGGVGNSGVAALVPGSYFSMQLNPNLWLGMSINAPFGLSVTFPDAWAGRNYSGDTTLRFYNATPTIAYRINDWISVGAGVQIQYASASVNTGLGATPGPEFNIGGSGWGYGFTAGVTLTPTPTTTVGIGWRSGVNQKINGALTTTVPIGSAATTGSVNTTLDLPDTVSLGIRQRLDSQWMLLGTVEWANWSRIGTATILQPTGAAATIFGTAVALPLQYRDGWFFSAGAEYKWNERLTLRSGFGYEISPIVDQVRTPRLPDNDRFWLSVGASWQLMPGMHFDLAYSHLFVKDPTINITATSGNPSFNRALPIPYVGDVSAHVDIISGSLVFQFIPSAPAKTALITK
jgi:long-chain fatty acid transport protein